MINPYATDDIVTSRDMLLGRSVHLRRLLRRVEALDCAAVVGPPGIGKSSLLYQLAHHDALRDRYLSLYVDLSGIGEQTVGAVVDGLVDGLGRELGRPVQGKSLPDLGRAFAALRDDEQLRVLLCLDDFDEFAQHMDRPDVLQETLREWGFNRLISLVIATRFSLMELAIRGTIPHRFVRLFEEEIALGLLPARDADRLVREPAREAEIDFPDEGVALTRELGGRHPLFLQLAGHFLFEQAGLNGELDLEAVREGFAEAAFPYLHRLWTFLSDEEREAARYYAGVAAANPPAVQVQQALIQKGILERREGAYCLFSEYAAEVVRRQRAQLEAPLSALQTGVGPEVPERESSEAEEPVVLEDDAAPELAPVVEEGLPQPQLVPPAVAAAGGAEVGEMSVETAEDTASDETTSLAVLGCYVLAITLDLLFVAGIVVGRLLLGLPSREMYVLIGLAAVFPVFILLLNRFAGGLWTRFFDRLLPRT